MRTKLFLWIFAFCSIYLHAQSVDEIEPQIEELIAHSVEGNYEKVLDFTHPKLFEIASREMMIQLFEQGFNNDKFEIKILPVEADIDISEVQTIEGEKYALISYNNALSMHFKDDSNLNKNFEDMLKLTYPNAEIEFREENNTYLINTRSKMLAISDEFTDGKWKYLNVNEQDKNLMQMLLKESVIKAFNL